MTMKGLSRKMKRDEKLYVQLMSDAEKGKNLNKYFIGNNTRDEQCAFFQGCASYCHGLRDIIFKN